MQTPESLPGEFSTWGDEGVFGLYGFGGKMRGIRLLLGKVF